MSNLAVSNLVALLVMRVQVLKRKKTRYKGNISGCAAVMLVPLVQKLSIMSLTMFQYCNDNLAVSFH